jgi:hypothetical protein
MSGFIGPYSRACQHSWSFRNVVSVCFCSAAGVIGWVTERSPGLVAVRTPLGATRVLDMLSGEQLPRIC